VRRDRGTRQEARKEGHAQHVGGGEMSNPQQGNVALRMKFEQTCQDCGESDFVEDHASGDLICRSCGRVAESHVIDEGTEWRSFGDKVRIDDYGD
jgi:ribosomal protein S27AE